MFKRYRGISLVEIMVAMAFAGLLAVLTIPKFLNNATEIQKSAASTQDLTSEQLVSIVQFYANERGIPIDPATPIDLVATPYEFLVTDYGNYLIKKDVDFLGGIIHNYFLLHDGARITMDPQIFTNTDPDNPLNEYKSTPTLGITNWNNKTTPAVPGYCSEFSQNECIYVDSTGKKSPNKIGKGGDIIPLRLDPGTGEVKTLYQWVLDLPPANLNYVNRCSFVSWYDVAIDATGASACP